MIIMTTHSHNQSSFTHSCTWWDNNWLTGDSESVTIWQTHITEMISECLKFLKISSTDPKETIQPRAGFETWEDSSCILHKC